jgi:hypothetical protein
MTTDLQEALTTWAEPTLPDVRVGFTTVRDRGDWNIAAIQYSFIAGTPGAPS